MDIEIEFPKRFPLGIFCLIVTELVGLGVANHIGNLWLVPGVEALRSVIAIFAIFLWIIVFWIVAREWALALKFVVFLVFMMVSIIGAALHLITFHRVENCRLEEVLSETKSVYHCSYGISGGGTFLIDVNSIYIELLEVLY